MDECDKASEYQRVANQAAASYRRPVPPIQPDGRCHACGEPVTGRLFCDGACADDYEAGERRP